MKRLSVNLQNRELRFDGISIIHPDRLAEALLAGALPHQLRLTEHSEESLLFNDNAGEQLLETASESVRLDFSWQLPQQYLEMDLRETIISRTFDKLVELNYPDDIHLKACERIEDELEEVERRGMVEFMKTIIYILDTFKEKGVIWGVGRGSSCASYILFILGLHSVDSVVFGVPMEEFFHD